MKIILNKSEKKLKYLKFHDWEDYSVMQTGKTESPVNRIYEFRLDILS